MSISDLTKFKQVNLRLRSRQLGSQKKTSSELWKMNWTESNLEITGRQFRYHLRAVTFRLGNISALVVHGKNGIVTKRMCRCFHTCLTCFQYEHTLLLQIFVLFIKSLWCWIHKFLSSDSVTSNLSWTQHKYLINNLIQYVIWTVRDISFILKNKQ